MRSSLKIAGLALAGGVLIASVAVAFAYALGPRRFEAPYPEIAASKDPQVLARGEYLVYGPAYCAHCHVGGQRKWELLADRDARPPLTGGDLVATPFGTAYVPNITSDDATGIGRLTDPEVARLLRWSVHRDGRAVLPFMDAQDLSDEDLLAVVSYLRAQPPVRHVVPAHEWNLLGRLFLAYFLTPQQPSEADFGAPSSGQPLARGRYLAANVANCVDCHTRGDISGRKTGPPYAGGTMYPDLFDERIRYSTPNLTPDPATGRIATWREEIFVARFRQIGRVYAGSPMPWENFARMTDADLGSLYAYLRSLDAVVNDTGPSQLLPE